MFLRILWCIVLLCFTFSSTVEAKHRVGSSHVSKTKKKTVKTNTPKKRAALKPRKKRQQVSRTKKRSKAAIVRKRQPRIVRTRKKQSPVLTKRKRASHSSRRPSQRPIPTPPTYLSQLKPHTQRNAQLGGLDKLYAQNLLGQEQTVAVIEYSGTWKEMTNIINKIDGNLPEETRVRYKRNFLAPIGGPGLHPEEKNEWIRVNDVSPYHGSRVSSAVLDLSPQASVLPISTYSCFQSGQYELANALMDLSQRPDVNVINVCGGCMEMTTETAKRGLNPDGTDKYVFRNSFPQMHIDAITALAKAGKVVVFGAGNDAKAAQRPEFSEEVKAYRHQFTGYLLETLDSETLQSVIFAGAFDPATGVARNYSNKPGDWPAAQERFLFAPCRHLPAYSDVTVEGTSFAAPYICAALANLCSKPGVTPKRAAKALLETADQRPERHIYGRGIARADKALEWLEAGGN